MIVAARTDPAAGHRGISLLVVERGMPGFSRGRNLDKLGMHAQAIAEQALADTLAYAKERNAFGQPIGKFQHNRFLLAEMATEIAVAREFTDRCVQLHGGYGYTREYAVGRAWTDSRVQSIFGGTTEIMKEIIGRGLGL